MMLDLLKARQLIARLSDSVSRDGPFGKGKASVSKKVIDTYFLFGPCYHSLELKCVFFPV